MYVDLFKPKKYFRCPVCGAVLDSDDDFVVMDMDGKDYKLSDIAGCSRCLRKVSVERMEEIYG